MKLNILGYEQDEIFVFSACLDEEQRILGQIIRRPIRATENGCRQTTIEGNNE